MRHNSIVRVAHRGASAQYPDNTLLAFHQAIEQGVEAFEIGIYRKIDDELVVIHDLILKRPTTGHGIQQGVT
jgi:glycerophosphoryl diester phosphodiesterase